MTRFCFKLSLPFLDFSVPLFRWNVGIFCSEQSIKMFNHLSVFSCKYHLEHTNSEAVPSKEGLVEGAQGKRASWPPHWHSAAPVFYPVFKYIWIDDQLTTIHIKLVWCLSSFSPVQHCDVMYCIWTHNGFCQ